jgi:hypothetical protein
VGLGVSDGETLPLRAAEAPNDTLRDAVGDTLALRDLLAALLALADRDKDGDGEREALREEDVMKPAEKDGDSDAERERETTL